METANIDKKRKERFAILCIGFSLPVIVGFTIVDLSEGDVTEVLINILMFMVLVAGLVGLRKTEAHRAIYRLGLGLLSVTFIYNIITGSGHGTAIYWLFPFPLVFFFFLGKREGSLAAAVFFCVLCILLINPFSFEIYAYGIGVSLRFLAALLLVTIMAYGLEASRDKSERMLMEKHTKLLDEKQHLQQALGEIKTLSGLIPICSNCKKIRDDKGYWQQVEVYVRDHTSAEFSHGLCPDCIKTLYPDYKDPVTG